MEFDKDISGYQIFSPPYDSPLEDLFAYNLLKYLNPAVIVHKQFEVASVCGLFRLDFLAELDGIRIGFECDGADFHDSSRDEWRDAMILGTGIVDLIYRLPGKVLHRHLEDALFLLSQRHPSLFSARGRANLMQLASVHARTRAKYNGADTEVIYPRESTEEGMPFRDTLKIWCHTMHVPKGQRSFLRTIFEFACKVGGGDLDSVIEAYMGRG